MVTPAQTGPDSHRYFATKPHRQSPGGKRGPQPKHQASPKTPLAPHNSQNQRQATPAKPKSPSTPNTRPKPTSPKPIMNHNNQNSHSYSHSPSPTNSRASPSRSTPSRSSPNNFANSAAYQPPTPSSLPKPPLSWTRSAPALLPSPKVMDANPTAHLRLLLNMQA